MLYTEALSRTENKIYQVKFRLNLAIVCFKLNLINEYGKNADRALEIDPKNVKAIYHRAKFLILKEKYSESQKFID